MDAWARFREHAVSGIFQVSGHRIGKALQDCMDTCAFQLETIEKLKNDRDQSVVNLLNEQDRLADVVRYLQFDKNELTEQRDVARANELGLKLDVAKLSGMLDAFREMMLP